ncbi:hypothetical protein [Rhodoplanes roseus]|uniref:Uncharacterized protein n=1 Tax=Rhodoplanes roseus TaxID=29409 RepID=A0A327KR04_9BRAD|nr:hypothetical protein [Rhodoplanes roseus]RAI41380.1 hypothetical protein CH341_21775 [Rhodoplanes roseus]
MKRIETSLPSRPAGALARILKNAEARGSYDRVAAPFDSARAETTVLRDVEGPDAAADRVVASVVRRLRTHFPADAGRPPGIPGLAPSPDHLESMGRSVAEAVLSEIVWARAPVLTADAAATDEVCMTLVDRLMDALEQHGHTIDPGIKTGFETALWEFREALTG